MKKRGLIVTLTLAASLFATPAAARQQDANPTLTTDDVRSTADSVTNANREREAEAETEAAKAAEKAGPPVSAGYERVTTETGYTFERPSTWKRVENLESKGAPSYFKYDAIFQDPATGAVISAVSVDRSQLDSPIDVTDTKAVNQLLATMLNPANKKDAVKVFRQVSGVEANGTRWIRIKAQGNGQAVDGSVVDTMFWVQLVQSDAKLALVAVGYPTAKQDAVAETAFHTVRTLEILNASPTGAPGGSEPGPAGGPAPKKKKDGSGGVREP
jgi:hypothetical protein